MLLFFGLFLLSSFLTSFLRSHPPNSADIACLQVSQPFIPSFIHDITTYRDIIINSRTHESRQHTSVRTIKPVNATIRKHHIANCTS